MFRILYRSPFGSSLHITFDKGGGSVKGGVRGKADPQGLRALWTLVP